jgi:hypothetical protein
MSLFLRAIKTLQYFLTSSTTISSSGQKRKRDEGFIDGCGGMKRSKSDDSHTVDVDTDVRKYEPDTGNIHSVEEAEADSLAGRESEAYGNCIHCCLVVSPAGRLLHSYRSSRELLEALRDVTLPTNEIRVLSFVRHVMSNTYCCMLHITVHRRCILSDSVKSSIFCGLEERALDRG